MYCGNNLANRDLVMGIKQLGTRYECLKKGIGVGMHLPADPTYLNAYVPHDQTKIYCGNNAVCPATHDVLGTPSLCLRKGVGIGKAIKARQPKKKRIITYIIISIVIILLIILILWYFYKKKQENFEETDEEKKRKAQKRQN